MVFAAVLTVVLVLVLKKGKNPEPKPDAGPHINPYRVLSYDAGTNTYTLSRWTNI